MRFLKQGGIGALAALAAGDAQQQGYAAAIMANLAENGACTPREKQGGRRVVCGEGLDFGAWANWDLEDGTHRVT